MPTRSRHSLRFGLCCLFVDEPIRFRSATAAGVKNLPRPQQLERFSAVCLHNARSLGEAVAACHRLGIGAFRITSPLFPRMTHPVVGYRLEDLPDADEIERILAHVHTECKRLDIRLSFHPDQFVVLSSPHREVVDSSVRELSYQGWLAEKVGADVITIHAGGTYGDKAGALARLRGVVTSLPDRVRSRLALENDDTSYTPEDLLPLCETVHIPFVYDVHHHRCNRDRLPEAEVTLRAAETWQGREPYCHLSSPKNGWGEGDPKPHADFIDPSDIPPLWLGMTMTVDIEAKQKERAILRLLGNLGPGSYLPRGGPG
ncbi:MAG: UV DNA damage repair endonuclease UvsE [Desulfuromonadia bacterium]